MDFVFGPGGLTGPPLITIYKSSSARELVHRTFFNIQQHAAAPLSSQDPFSIAQCVR